MRPVVLVTSFAIPHVGGASSHFELLERHLWRRGQLAGTITGSMASGWVGPRKMATLAARLGWENPRAAQLQGLVARLARMLASERPAAATIFHCHDPLASCAVLKVRKAGDSLVQTVHGPLSREVVGAGYRSAGAVEQTLKSLERTAFGNANLLLPVDCGQAAILREEFSVSSDRLRIIRNAVDADELRGPRDGGTKSPRGDGTFLAPRRLVKKNGVDVAIRALGCPEAASFRVVVAGDGPERRRLKGLARESGVRGRVRFAGSVSHSSLISMMRTSCGVIVPSVPFAGVVEATSMALLEAMACGVPVIGSNVGGLAEIIGSGDFGWLVSPGDPKALAEAMLAIKTLDEVSRKERLERARERVRNEFGIARWMAAILEAYEAA